MNRVLDQAQSGEPFYGSINTIEDLKINLKENAISEDLANMNVEDYYDFLDQRRRLMSKYIKDYYFSL